MISRTSNTSKFIFYIESRFFFSWKVLNTFRNGVYSLNILILQIYNLQYRHEGKLNENGGFNHNLV